MARPTREDTASTVVVTFRLTTEERLLLESIATRRQASVSDVLRALIRKEAVQLAAPPPRDDR